MKKISVQLSQLSTVENVLKLPEFMEYKEDATIIDIIHKLDVLYHKKTEKDQKDHSRDFINLKIISLLQLLWNPETQKFYEDVGVEARTSFPESKMIWITRDWKTTIPDGSWIILTPDAGC